MDNTRSSYQLRSNFTHSIQDEELRKLPYQRKAKDEVSVSTRKLRPSKRRPSQPETQVAYKRIPSFRPLITAKSPDDEDAKQVVQDTDGTATAAGTPGLKKQPTKGNGKPKKEPQVVKPSTADAAKGRTTTSSNAQAPKAQKRASRRNIPLHQARTTKSPPVPAPILSDSELKGIPSHLEIQLYDPSTGEKFVYDRESKKMKLPSRCTSRKSPHQSRSGIHVQSHDRLPVQRRGDISDLLQMLATPSRASMRTAKATAPSTFQKQEFKVPVVDINHRFREILNKSRSQSNEWVHQRNTPFQQADSNPVLMRVETGASSPKHQKRFTRSKVMHSDKGTSPFRDDMVSAADVVNSFAQMAPPGEMNA